MTVTTVHGTKGRAAEHVLLVHAVEGVYGFPPRDRENEPLEPVQPVETNTIEEERRLFYAAMARTSNTPDILTREGQRSRFIGEPESRLEAGTPPESISTFDEVGMRVTFPAQVGHRYGDTYRKICQRGSLEDATGSMLFVSRERDDPPVLEGGARYMLRRHPHRSV